MVTVTTDNATNAEGLADAREAAAEDPRACYNAPACPCYSCDRQCGGTIHPQSCGPVEADAEGRPICRTCRDLAQVWGDHRTGLQATVTQDRVRVAVKFGESAWLNPESARAFAGVLMEQAARLDKQREADALDAATIAAYHAGADAPTMRLNGCTCATPSTHHRPPCPWAMR